MCGILLLISGIQIEDYHSNFSQSDFYLPESTFMESVEIEKWHLKSSKSTIRDEKSLLRLLKGIEERGPTKQQYFQLAKKMGMTVEMIDRDGFIDRFKGKEDDFDCIGMSSVLALRLNKKLELQAQPLYKTNSKSFLMYNGELYSLSEEYKAGLEKLIEYGVDKSVLNAICNFDFSKSDSLQLSEIFLMISLSKKHTVSDIREIFRTVLFCFSGEYCFVFYCDIRKTYIFSKDYFGRRSLMISCFEDHILIHSASIYNGDKNINDAVTKLDLASRKYLLYFNTFKNSYSLDIPSNSIFSLELQKKEFFYSPLVTKKEITVNSFFKPNHVQNIFFYSLTSKTLFDKNYLMNRTIFALDYLMNKTISNMVKDRNIVKEPIGVLFSGGLDSTLVAYYAIKNSEKEVK